MCVVTETFPPEVNGVALTLSRLVEGLRARGHCVAVVRPQQHGEERSPRNDPDLSLVRGFPLPGYPAVRLGAPAVARLYRLWSRNRPDAIYVATEGPLGWAAAGAARRLGIPVLSGFHTNFDAYARYYGQAWLGRPIAYYLRWFHNQTLATIVPSPDLRGELARRGFRRLQILERGVDTGLFAPARRSARLRHAWGVGEDDIVVLYVGRLAPEKNVELAVRAYRAMQESPRVRRFVVVGDGPQGASLQAAHPDLGFCSVQRGERLAAHYASADVFLFPSETETFGNVTLEAMASGLAVVAYDYAAARRHITDGQTGLLARRGDAASFIERAIRLASSPRILDDLRRRARAAILPFDWQRVVERFEDLLLSLRPRREEVVHGDD